MSESEGSPNFCTTVARPHMVSSRDKQIRVRMVMVENIAGRVSVSFNLLIVIRINKFSGFELS